MNSRKIIFAFILVSFCHFDFSQALKCYTCYNSRLSCNKAILEECTDAIANSTKNLYLDMYHTGVNLSTTSTNLQCFIEELRFTDREVVYKGCTYENIKGCDLPLRRPGYYQSCYQCYGDGCNSAGSVGLNLLLTVATSFVTLSMFFKW